MRRRHSQAFLHYPKTLGERVYSLLILPIAAFGALFLIIHIFNIPVPLAQSVSIPELILATGATLLRLMFAFLLALISAIPLAILATYNKTTERILLPLFDILESVPVLAFFPIFILFFLHIHFISGAAIFILFLSMLWNIVFTTIGGIKIIPQDIISAARMFGISGVTYIRHVLLPAIFPEIITGAILACAQGWNIIIVAEALHTYLPGNSGGDLFGIGSVLVNASSGGETGVFIMSLCVMVLTIALLNYFVWQKLLRYAERFRFE